MEIQEEPTQARLEWEAKAAERRKAAREAASAWGEAALMWNEAPQRLRAWAQTGGPSIVWEWGKESPEEAREFARRLAQSEPMALGQRVCAGLAWLGAMASGEEDLPFSIEVEVSWESPGEPQYRMKSMKNTKPYVCYEEEAMALIPEAQRACVSEAIERVMDEKDWEDETEGDLPGYDFLDSSAIECSLRGGWAAGMNWSRVGEAVTGAFEQALLEESTPEAQPESRSVSLRV